MPTLQIFVPCDKAIVSNEDNSSSLIAVLDVVGANITPEMDLSQPLMVAKQWHMFAQWLQLPEDEGVEYAQYTWLELPNGVRNSETNLSFSMTQRIHRTMILVNGFPAQLAGEYQAKLELRRAGESDLLYQANYKILVIHNPPPLNDFVPSIQSEQERTEVPNE